jgi:hypothetical protein
MAERLSAQLDPIRLDHPLGHVVPPFFADRRPPGRRRERLPISPDERPGLIDGRRESSADGCPEGGEAGGHPASPLPGTRASTGGVLHTVAADEPRVHPAGRSEPPAIADESSGLPNSDADAPRSSGPGAHWARRLPSGRYGSNRCSSSAALQRGLMVADRPRDQPEPTIAGRAERGADSWNVELRRVKPEAKPAGIRPGGPRGAATSQSARPPARASRASRRPIAQSRRAAWLAVRTGATSRRR